MVGRLSFSSKMVKLGPCTLLDDRVERAASRTAGRDDGVRVDPTFLLRPCPRITLRDPRFSASCSAWLEPTSMGMSSPVARRCATRDWKSLRIKLAGREVISI